MRVEVSIHEDARAAYADWIDGWGIDDPQVRALNRLYARELIGVLRDKLGQIEAAECIHQEEPCVYEWKYTGDMTIRFMVKKAKSYFGRGICRIIIIEILPDSAPQADEETPLH